FVDGLGQAGAGLGNDRRGLAELAQQGLELFAVDGALGGEYAGHASDSDLCCRLDAWLHTDDWQVVTLPQRGDGGCRGRIAGNHDGLDVACDQEAGELLCPVNQQPGRLVAIGRPCQVCDVEKVLSWKLSPQFLENGKTADA